MSLVEVLFLLPVIFYYLFFFDVDTIDYLKSITSLKRELLNPYEKIFKIVLDSCWFTKNVRIEVSGIFV